MGLSEVKTRDRAGRKSEGERGAGADVERLMEVVNSLVSSIDLRDRQRSRPAPAGAWVGPGYVAGPD